MDALMLDGNAVAGALREVFAMEMTTAIWTCGACGTRGPVGAAHLYRGAAAVLRCPQCEHVLATLVSDGRRTWMGLAGVRTLEVAME